MSDPRVTFDGPVPQVECPEAEARFVIERIAPHGELRLIYTKLDAWCDQAGVLHLDTEVQGPNGPYVRDILTLGPGRWAEIIRLKW